MSIAATSVADSTISGEGAAPKLQKAPAKRQTIAKADAVPAPEPR